MKLSLSVIVAFATIALAVVQPQKAVIISYPDNTPEHVIEEAKQAIIHAGGIITHEYKLIKGFAAKAPAKILESVQAWGNDYHAVIEEDQMVSVNSGGQ